MAFSNSERVKIRKYLGYPSFRSTDTSLESAIDLVGADVDGSAEVRIVLVNLATIETEISGLHGIALAEKVEESTLNPRRYADLRTAGRRECRQLAILLHATIADDAFATGGWSGGPLGAG